MWNSTPGLESPYSGKESIRCSQIMYIVTGLRGLRVAFLLISLSHPCIFHFYQWQQLLKISILEWCLVIFGPWWFLLLFLVIHGQRKIIWPYPEITIHLLTYPFSHWSVNTDTQQLFYTKEGIEYRKMNEEVVKGLTRQDEELIFSRHNEGYGQYLTWIGLGYWKILLLVVKRMDCLRVHNTRQSVAGREY